MFHRPDDAATWRGIFLMLSIFIVYYFINYDYEGDLITVFLGVVIDIIFYLRLLWCAASLMDFG